jgi:glycine/D-amino acid oxidase-like deaminating enzyme
VTGASSPGPVDVAIVGGGIVGAATAVFLAEAGLRVRLHEMTSVAAAASGRNSGVVQHPFDPVLASLYRETVGHYRALAETPGAGAERFSLPADPAGLLMLGRDEAAARRTAAAWRATHPDVAAEVLDGRALRGLEPSLADGLVACRLGIGFPVAPAAATRAFAGRAVAAGADLQVGRRASIVLREGVAAEVDVDGQVAAAGAVVVAAGPWTCDLIDPGGGWRPIGRSWGVVAAIRLAAAPRHVLEEATIDIEPEEPGDGTRGAFGFSLVPAGTDSSLGSTFLADEPDPTSLVDHLATRGASFVPAVASAAVSALRSCARPVSRDGRPLVGAVPGVERLFVAAGHGPWGISTGPATARLVADAVLGRGAGIPAELDAGRFGPIATG